MPIAWKGTIAQYAGRLHRNFEGKKEVLIYDYVDVHIPVLERMYHKRLTAYRSIGYSIKDNNSKEAIESRIFDEANYFEHLIQDIKRAEKNILISSSFLQKKKINEIKKY
jgi:superfamily II DNA or RNA helicase